MAFDPTFILTWEAELARQVGFLNLEDPEDRVTYRQRVKTAMLYLSYDGHRELAQHFGIKAAQSKEGTARKLADAWMRQAGVDFR